MYDLPTPHGDKLNALLENEKLPATDRRRVSDAISEYEGWLEKLKSIAGEDRETVVGW